MLKNSADYNNGAELCAWWHTCYDFLYAPAGC